MGGNCGSSPWYLDVATAPWQAYRSATHVTLDLETTNKEKGDARNPANRIVTAALQVNGGEIIDGLDVLDWFKGRSEPTILVAHNSKFELSWLNRIGVDTTHLLPWDTMIAEYVLAGNRKVKLDLGSVARRYGQKGKARVVDLLMKGGICPSEIPSHLLRERVRGDVEATTGIFYAQREVLDRAGLTKVHFTRCIATPVLAHIEAAGMTLDPVEVNAMYETAVRERAVLEGQLSLLTGGINMRSRPKLAEFLYDKLGFEELKDRRGDPRRTPTGQRLTDGDALDNLVAKTPEQKQFVALRQKYGSVDAMLSKNLEFFVGVVEERDSRFYGTFNQTVTRTHRLSASGKRLKFARFKKEKSVQFQNLPRAMKRLFCARSPDRVVAEADGAQLEFRVAGSLGRDPQVLDDVVHEADIHRFTASVLSRVLEDKVTEGQRTLAKPDTFKPLYGGQSGTKRQMEYYEAFRRKYDEVYTEQQRWVLEVLRHKKLRTVTGLIFYWPDTEMRQGGYVTNTPSIFNYPVQSLATADIIPVSMVYLFWAIIERGLDAILINTVHDSVVADVAKKDVDKYRETVVECFLDRTYEYLERVYGIDLYVPLGVGFKAGDHWGAGDEVKVSYAKRAV